MSENAKFYGRKPRGGEAIVQTREMAQIWEFIVKAMTGEFTQAEMGHAVSKLSFWSKLARIQAQE